MAVSAKVSMKAAITETLATSVAGITSPTVAHDAFSIDNITLDASSTPPATTVVSFTQALSSGTATIDLTALTGTNGLAVDLTGLKVQLFYIEATSTNTGQITYKPGAANGYNLGGEATFIGVIGTGTNNATMHLWVEDSQDVATADAEIDLAGTGAESCDIIIVAG